MISVFVTLIVVGVLAIAAIAVIAALGAAGVAIVAAPISLIFSLLWGLLKLCLKAAVVIGVIYFIYRLCRGISQRS